MSLYTIIYRDDTPSADTVLAAQSLVGDFSSRDDAPKWFAGEGFVIVHWSRLSSDAAEAVWERRYNEQTQTALLCATQRDELAVALRACLGALEFFKKAGFNGGCILAASAARAALASMPFIPTEEAP